MLDKPEVKATNDGDFQAVARNEQVSRGVDVRSGLQSQ
jgi:hypothetical protein